MEALVRVSRYADPERWPNTPGNMPPIAGGAPTLDELRTRNDVIRSRLQEINIAAQGRQFTEDERGEWNAISSELTSNEDAIEEMEAREAWLSQLSNRESAREQGAHFGVPPARSQAAREDLWDTTTIRSLQSHEEQVFEARDRARRAVEEFTFPHEDIQRGKISQAFVREHLNYLLETAENKDGDLAMHILRCGSPMYKRAFGKMMTGQRLTPDEERALAVSTGSTGGFAVPITIDPTMIPISNGVVNPMRRVAKKVSIVGYEYRQLTAGAVTATYAPEGTEVGDNSPTIGQPDVFVERAQTFIPYSIEIGMDWNGLQADMVKLMGDAKDVLEGNKFTLGAGHGSTEPAGLLTGATSTVATASSASFAVADLYAVEEALGPRFRPMAQWFGNRHAYNLVRQFGANATQNLFMAFNDQGQGPLQQGLANRPFGEGGGLVQTLLGYPLNEVSDMSTSIATGQKILALGDPNYYTIVDRIGMTVELVPHLFGSSRRPTGQRGWYAYWRNTGFVTDPNAFRVLVSS